MPKYKIYAILALLIMTVAFTIPALGFFKLQGRIVSGEITSAAQMPLYAAPIWTLYTKASYKNHLVPNDVKNDLGAMLEHKFEVGVPSIPVWKISLEAPNYPKEAFPDGIPLYVHVDGFSGDVGEMNTLNHYIGMYPVWRGGTLEHSLSPYYLIIATIGMLAFLYYDGKGQTLLMILPIIAPLIFMPTAFGDGSVAHFTTHSYPALGFWLMLALSLLSALALLSKKKFLREHR